MDKKETRQENKCGENVNPFEVLPPSFDPNGDPKESYENALKHFERCKTGIRSNSSGDFNR
jgi:hypothetical protein